MHSYSAVSKATAYQVTRLRIVHDKDDFQRITGIGRVAPALVDLAPGGIEGDDVAHDQVSILLSSLPSHAKACMIQAPNSAAACG